jgi:hypothetical protein
MGLVTGSEAMEDQIGAGQTIMIDQFGQTDLTTGQIGLTDLTTGRIGPADIITDRIGTEDPTLIHNLFHLDSSWAM